MATLLGNTLWDVNGNGFRSQLRIISVDVNNGQVTGSIQDDNCLLILEGDKPGTNAVWKEDARQLTFARTLPNGERQTFTGSLFDDSGEPNFLYAMAGTFVADRFEDPRRPVFGWFALGTGGLN
jgi:hypothetical protein